MATKNAKLGLLIATSLSLYLIFRLIQAGAPAPTSVRLSNLGPTPVTVTGLRMGDKDVLHEQATLRPAAAGASAAESSSKVIDLPVGRPIEVSAELTGTNARATCKLEARPHGSCIIRASFLAGAGLKCDYECKAAP